MSIWGNIFRNKKSNDLNTDAVCENGISAENESDLNEENGSEAYVADASENDAKNDKEMLEQHANDVAWFRRLMSHNIRMPLAIISGYIELLQSGELKTEEEIADCIQNISRNVDFMNNLTKAVLDDNAANITDNMEKMDLLKVISDSCAYVKNIAMKAGISLSVNCAYDEVWMMGNQLAIMRAFFNLIENSIRYMNKAGDITINVERDENDIIVIYRDNGMGMNENEIEHIYEEGFRGSNTRSNGSGFGMYLLNQTIKNHNGTVEVKSGLGKGMLIYITMPSNL